MTSYWRARYAQCAWPLLKRGGLLCFDDYEWSGCGEPPRDVLPGPAIDAFLSVYSPVLEVVHRGYQVWARKLA